MAQTELRQGRPGVIGGTSPLPQSIFGKEMGSVGSESTATFSAGFLKTYSVEDLGKKLRMLRPQGKEKDWFSVKELSERLVRLREMEKEQAQSNANNDTFSTVVGTLVEIDEKKKRGESKASSQ